MSQSVPFGDAAPCDRRGGAAASGLWTVPDTRRKLQLALGAIWLLDAILQFQAFMFTRAFAPMLAASAVGNPAILARPILWSASLIGQHAVAANMAFACIQLALGLGIAWRPSLKAALAASIVWSLAVWWLGEGFGAVLSGAASPVNGAPGGVILYALLAVLLWPAARDRSAPFLTARVRSAPFPAGRAVGPAAARGLWLLLWGSLAYFALQPAARAPQSSSAMISGMASGQPGWLAWLDHRLAALLAGQGLPTAVALAAALAAVAIGPYLRPHWARATLILALALAAFLWIAEGLGGILTGSGTDPNTGPLLALLALAYWPATASPVTGPPVTGPPVTGPPVTAAPAATSPAATPPAATPPASAVASSTSALAVTREGS
jgi:hypothetical protein